MFTSVMMVFASRVIGPGQKAGTFSMLQSVALTPVAIKSNEAAVYIDN